MNQKNKIKWLVYNALLIAIIVVLSLVPMIGYIQIGAIAFTTVHIPVIIGAILLGPKSGLLLGVAFGLSSWFVASTRAAGVADLMFTNPLISVVPRIIFSIGIGFIYQLFSRLFKNKDQIAVGITAFLSSVFHSFVVLVALAFGFSVAGNLSVSSGFALFIGAFFATGVLFEAIAASIVAIGVVEALRKTMD